MRSNLYQYALIALGVVSTILFGMFWKRELFPEYRLYQNHYVELEKFRTTYTHEPPPSFETGVKQIVMEREDKGPPVIDRCISCHVALQFPHFSPTRIAKDLNGAIVFDADGKPKQEPNEDYVWKHLDDEIERLTDPRVNEQLEQQGEMTQIKDRVQLAEKYKALKTVKVGHHVYDVTKALRMHPLMGRETRAFEFHPIEEYGCVTCHNGNGRGLTSEKAHGPVFDGEYEGEFMGPKPEFTEPDPQNDPPFSRMFNHKPGPSLIFQTTPILIGPLIQAKCMNCHQKSVEALQSAINSTGAIAGRKVKQLAAVRTAFENEKQNAQAILELLNSIAKYGIAKTLQDLEKEAENYTLPQERRDQVQGQIHYLNRPGLKAEILHEELEKKLTTLVGNEALTQELLKDNIASQLSASSLLDKFLVEHKQDRKAVGSLFAKASSLEKEQAKTSQIVDTQATLQRTVQDDSLRSSVVSDVDLLTANYQRGEALYISQACYACHRIAGFARGGVGPELTHAGQSYPWFLKESMVWPQADLPSSTMPNYRMDHEELQDLMTFLMAQQGANSSISNTNYKISIQEWEGGKRIPLEQTITPNQIHNLHFGMTVFAEEGCAACHRLKGFTSNVGYSKEKEDKKDLPFEESQWFWNLIPEGISGSELVKVIEKNAAEIDRRIVHNVRKDSILEEIDRKLSGQVESLYSPFKYASRYKDARYTHLISQEKDLNKKALLQKEWKTWKDRVHRLLMMFVQEYGLGRLVGPRPNWSGVFRSDEWLMEHFKNPSSHVPRSIMPVFPFDDTKFYALTYMLDILGQKNRDDLRLIWETIGFNPSLAYKLLCSQCHGDFLQGNGPVSEWIYPIPKNLRNADFLRNLTKERVIFSIEHGVKGTPMPPWGEVAPHKVYLKNTPVLNQNEIKELANWIFSTLPGAGIIRGPQDVPKWQYSPEDVLRELNEEGNQLKDGLKGNDNAGEKDPTIVSLTLNFPSAKGFIASLQPIIAEREDTTEPIPVNQVFDIRPPLSDGPDKHSYYIKKKYYTQENILAGKNFFELNCAVCHGKEADGSGSRASAMKEAKPRMLTNLDWGNVRDDLRWLRSIKYGVAGTAMNPWGDLTSSLQRLQLVIYLRTLSEENILREKLITTLYQAFEHEVLTVEEARIHEYSALAELQRVVDDLQKKRKNIYEEYQAKGGPIPEEAANLYQKELIAIGNLREREEIDKTLQNLKDEILKERDIYQSSGLFLLSKVKGGETFNKFLDLVTLNKGSYFYLNGSLKANFSDEIESKIALAAKQLDSDLDALIKEKENEEKNREKLSLKEQTDLLNKLKTDLAALKQLKNKIISDMEAAVRSRKRQKTLYQAYIKKLDALKTAALPKEGGKKENSKKALDAFAN